MAKNPQNGQTTPTLLENALTNMLAAQSAMLAQQADLAREQSVLAREHTKLEREIHNKFNQIMRVLDHHSLLFERLPEAVREKIGFRPNQ